MSGDNSKFTGIDIPLPTFSSSLDTQILKKPSFNKECWTNYIHFSLAINKVFQYPVCVALNINQELLKPGQKRDVPWKDNEDDGGKYQLNNDYYINNNWDKGHMARFATSAWGETEEDAGRAGDDNMFYSNACLQHKNLNRDEWLGFEDWVKDLTTDDNNMISTFSGPIYGDIKTFVTPPGRQPAEIPQAFFKKFSFIKGGALLTRAFTYMQDKATMEGLWGRRFKAHMSYQVTNN